MGRRKATKLMGAYVNPSEVPEFDRLVKILHDAGLIKDGNRSEMIRYCMNFVLDFMQNGPDIESLSLVKDYLTVEQVIPDSMGALVSLSSEFVSKQIIDNFGRAVQA